MKPVVPVHVFTGPVFSYNKTNVICHIHYFNPRKKVYIKMYIYIFQSWGEKCALSTLQTFHGSAKSCFLWTVCLVSAKKNVTVYICFIMFDPGDFILFTKACFFGGDLCFLYHPQMVSSVWLCAGCQQDGIDLHFPQLSYMWSHTSGAGLKPQSNIWL